MGEKLILIAGKQCSMIVVPWDRNIHYAGDHLHRATYPAQVLPWILNVRPGQHARRSIALLGQACGKIADLAAVQDRA
ncbi:MAG: hypothetical protein KJO10_05070 [Gammaproteobacteria bacterium]|nr:hypothetical protein [Gammaproteobacteria bacterium]